VTGANGFVGKALCSKLVSEKHQVSGTIRYTAHAANLPPEVSPVTIPSIGSNTDWIGVLSGINTVIHLAGRVHVMKDNAADPLAAFRSVNVAGTERLARTAADTGVNRFIFISSIKVNGESSTTPYKENDIPHPQDPYGISKWEAEQVLNKISSETGMETVIIRPPLIYGPEVRANFLRLLRMVERGIPLPFARIDNRRSLIYLGNLVDAIAACMNHPRAANQTFLVSDADDVSTADLVRRIANAMNKSDRLFSLPPAFLSFMATFTGKKDFYNRLCGSLTVDAGAISSALGWKPPFSLQEGIAHTVDWYLRTK